MVRPVTVISDIMITVRPIVWAIQPRSGLSVTMRVGMEKMRRTAAVMKKTNVCANNGWQSRKCVLQPVISMWAIQMRITMGRIQLLWRPCWRTGTRHMKVSLVWNIVTIWKKKRPVPVIFFMVCITMMKK